MINNIRSEDATEKRISLIYNSEISGFQALDFSKIDGIEGLLNNTFVTGDNIPSGITVYQANLDKDLDNISVYVSGQALDHLSSLVTGGISLKGINTVNVNVTGGSLNVINEVEIKNEQNNPVPVSGPLTDTQLRANAVPVTGDMTANILQFVAFDDIKASNGTNNANAAVNIGFNTQGNEFKQVSDTDPLPINGTVTAKTEKSSTISNSTPGSSNGTVLNANADRKELYIQNLSTGNLYVKYGGGVSNTSFNFVLAANSATNAGDGGSLSDQAYTGIVSVSGVSPSYISWERS